VLAFIPRASRPRFSPEVTMEIDVFLSLPRWPVALLRELYLLENCNPYHRIEDRGFIFR